MSHTYVCMVVHKTYCSAAELSKLCMKVVDITGSLRCIGFGDIEMCYHEHNYAYLSIYNFIASSKYIQFEQRRL